MLLSEALDKIKGTNTYISIDIKDGTIETFKEVIDMAKVWGV